MEAKSLSFDRGPVLALNVPRPFRKQRYTLRIVFSDERFFDIDSANEHMWVINCADADEKGAVMQKKKFF